MKILLDQDKIIASPPHLLARRYDGEEQDNEGGGEELEINSNEYAAGYRRAARDRSNESDTTATSTGRRESRGDNDGDSDGDSDGAIDGASDIHESVHETFHSVARRGWRARHETHPGTPALLTPHASETGHEPPNPRVKFTIPEGAKAGDKFIVKCDDGRRFPYTILPGRRGLPGVEVTVAVEELAKRTTGGPPENQRRISPSSANGACRVW